ncbi:hypothetical protein OIU76_011602 [Salix suchowensis]|nr:hypothetical protein OIU76_011602 [Salix suchowensis]
MLGLGKARVEVASQLASKSGFQRKFAACLAFLMDSFYLAMSPVTIHFRHRNFKVTNTPLVTSPNGSSLLGSTIPKIDLILLYEMVKWGVHGRNATVPASDEVRWLGFLDGGKHLVLRRCNL